MRGARRGPLIAATARSGPSRRGSGGTRAWRSRRRPTARSSRPARRARSSRRSPACAALSREAPRRETSDQCGQTASVGAGKGGRVRGVRRRGGVRSLTTITAGAPSTSIRRVSHTQAGSQTRVPGLGFAQPPPRLKVLYLSNRCNPSRRRPAEALGPAARPDSTSRTVQTSALPGREVRRHLRRFAP